MIEPDKSDNKIETLPEDERKYSIKAEPSTGFGIMFISGGEEILFISDL